jgi:hypothetical protein
VIKKKKLIVSSEKPIIWNERVMGQHVNSVADLQGVGGDRTLSSNARPKNGGMKMSKMAFLLQNFAPKP